MENGDLDLQFVQAQADVNALSERPDNAVMLKLYALFKQASKGSNTQAAPGAFDFVARAKHDAWAALGSMTQDEAKQAYIALVKGLQA